jgi:ankyrin repeat protein
MGKTKSKQRGAAARPALDVSEGDIIEAIETGELSRLREWAKRGVRLSSAVQICVAAQENLVDAIRLLVKEFGANVNEATELGVPLFIAAGNGNLAAVHCLVKEFGADVNRAREDDGTPLFVAAQNGRVDVVRCLMEEFGAVYNRAI